MHTRESSNGGASKTQVQTGDLLMMVHASLKAVVPVGRSRAVVTRLRSAVQADWHCDGAASWDRSPYEEDSEWRSAG